MEGVTAEVTELEDSRVRVRAQVPPGEVQRRVDQTAQRLGRQLRVPGFRRGKVPSPVVISRIGREAVLDEALRGSLAGWYVDAIDAAGISTVGDPKLDLGWVVQSWPTDTMSPEAATSGYVDMVGMPSRDEVLAHYAEVSGRQVDDIEYYIILAKWKLAVVLEQGYQRAGDDEKLLAFGPIVLDLMKGAAELAATTDYRS